MEKVIVSIDHGNRFCKSVGRNENFNLMYLTGFVKSQIMPIIDDNLLQYNGMYYSIGQTRFPVIMPKYADERVFILTLPAIANRMKEEGLKEAEIILGVGLPISVFGSQKEKFREYFLREGGIRFIFNGEKYFAKIGSCYCFAQSYSAFLTLYNSYKSINGQVNVIDIGSFTVDIFTARNAKLIIDSARSLNMGIIKPMKRIQQEVLKMGIEISEEQIEDVLLNRKPIFMSDNIVNIVEDTMKDYTNSLLAMLLENGFETKISPNIFIGGGAALLRRFIENNADVPYAEFVDIYGNSRGYQLLTQTMIEKGR